MVRRRPAGGQAGICRRRERGRVVSPARRQRLDHRQGRDHRLVCSRRRSRRAWGETRAKSTASSLATWAIRFTNASTLPPRRSKRPRWQKLSPADVHVTELAGEKIQQILTAAPGDGKPDRRNQGDRRRMAGSPRVLRAPKRSTRFTPRASSAKSTCDGSKRKLRQLLRTRLHGARELQPATKPQEGSNHEQSRVRQSSSGSAIAERSPSWLWTCDGLSIIPRTSSGNAWIPNFGS